MNLTILAGIGLLVLYVVVKVITHYVQKVHDENMMLRNRLDAERREKGVLPGVPPGASMQSDDLT